MLNYCKSLIIVIVLAFLCSIKVYAEDNISINELIEKAKELNESQVTIRGEAIGDRMDRGDYTWVNVNDGTNAIGVWLNKSEADKIKYYGSYKWKGDTVEITGTFYRTCKEHNGEADIHGKSVRIVKAGNSIQHRVPSAKVITAGVIMVLAALSAVIYVRLFRHRKTFL
ncbi:hypothetical protein QA584_13555 [Anaerocolumna sp. AGMB13025]|uniref:hypothetical protein n=1 Tax=Anaerocolumna sp. AGMB13025 TaxID=3039116 RepID=UPI00241FE2C5|nr:hypothetical protein [Anaerocolumna sp. AGMB13025]WFR60059.1 hypothetical protein QA584_13555 [Anaerocolumna sp. AGMB13025]